LSGRRPNAICAKTDFDKYLGNPRCLLFVAELKRSGSSIGRQMISSTSAENLNSTIPPSSDRVDLAPIWFRFDRIKKRVEEGGWPHQAPHRVRGEDAETTDYAEEEASNKRG
jgi:hypothetical protein